MNVSTEVPHSAPDVRAADRAREVERAAEDTARDMWWAIRGSVRLIWDTCLFLLFALYALLAVIAFWLWAVAALALALRLLFKLVMVPLLWLSDGAPRGHLGEPRKVKEAFLTEWKGRWERRHESYAAFARPMAAWISQGQFAARRFWYLTFARKLLVVSLAFFLVFVPGLFLIPRVNYVQVIDDNAINQYAGGTQVEYLIHGVDLFDQTHTREYQNVNMPWLGKLNSQGMKNKLVPGRYYKVWVIGLRWYIPQMYPNLISVTETDAKGVPLENPSHFIPATTTGQ